MTGKPWADKWWGYWQNGEQEEFTDMIRAVIGLAPLEYDPVVEKKRIHTRKGVLIVKAT